MEARKVVHPAKRAFTDYVSAYRIIDGDTLEITAELRNNIKVDFEVRLARIDAPESKGAGAKANLVVVNAIDQWLQRHMNLTVTSFERDTEKYGRWLCDLNGSKGDGTKDSLCGYLIANELVHYPYTGGKKQDWTAKELAWIEDFKP